jgi:flavin-dependent thymidylate synthase
MNNNTVKLIGHYGDDEVHACSAWTSTSREITDEKQNRIPQLLSFLAKEGHHTPFEKSSLHFLVDCDIASHIHLLKHRIGVSINAESARYKELKEDKYIVPDDWSKDWQDKLTQYTQQGNELYHQCVADLEPMLGRKRAKESARFFKTYNSRITSDVMFNWRSFYHFQGLRNKPEAQKEIREIAQMMLDLVKNIEGNPFEHTIAAFGL